MSQSCAARARLRQKELLCPELLGDDQSRSRDTDEAEKSEKSPLEKLALKGSCVKDGGEVHAMLLVAMRPEQRQLLPQGLSSSQNARLFAFVRRLTVLQGSSFCLPRLWCGDARRAMLKLQADRRLALATVANRGLALQHMPPELRDDKEVVLVAVRKKARALEFAAPRLQGDLEVVLEALKAPGGHKALPFVSEHLMSDHRIGAASHSKELLQLKDAPVQAEALDNSQEGRPAQNPILSQEMLCLLHL